MALPSRLRTLSVPLPAGHLVHGSEGADLEPAMWVSDGPTTAQLCSSLRAEHHRSGLWPFVLDTLRGDPARPWDDGELWPGGSSSPEDFHPGALLADWWRSHAESGNDWPGLMGGLPNRTDPGRHAGTCTAELLAARPELRLGLVAADRSADALGTVGWQGAVNYIGDTAQLSSVLRSWEDRFGVRVIGLGFAELYVSVAAPPSDVGESRRVAAEHFAFCPDNVWQGTGSIDAYADSLVNAPMWSFWWD